MSRRSDETLDRMLTDSARSHRFMVAQDRLASVAMSSRNLDEFLEALLGMFVEVTGVDVAVVRVREGDRLKSRAAVGLEEEVQAGFSLPIDQGVTGKCVAERAPVTISSAEFDTL